LKKAKNPNRLENEFCKIQFQPGGLSALNLVSSIFSQLLKFFNRDDFDRAVGKHKAERHARGFTCWGQFVAMLFCQLGRAQSLREICGGLATCEGKLKHLGVPKSPKRSTLSYANEHRPWELYRTVFQDLYQRIHQELGPRKKFRFKNPLVSLDASVIDLCATLYDWAKYRRRKGGVKLHLLLDHDGYLPKYAVIEAAKKPEVKVARLFRFETGTMVVFDRGYIDYRWFEELNQGVYFVTRARWNTYYTVVERRGVPKNGAVRKDEVVRLGHRAYRRNVLVRRVVVWDAEKQKELVFLSNHMEFAASTIARIYRDRWQIETFFKALKQYLRVKTFVGTSANALQIQIWTALIAMLLLKYLQLKAQFGWSLSNLVALLRQQLFVYRDLWKWLNCPFEAPPIPQQPHQLDLGFSKA
jgi:hypothetical protein